MKRFIIIPVAALAFAVTAWASEITCAGQVKSVDAKAGTITLTLRGEKAREDKTISVDKDARILFDGKEKKLGDIPTGTRATVKFDEEKKKAIEIDVKGGERPKAGERPAERPKTGEAPKTEPGKTPERPAPGTADERRAKYAEQQKFVMERWRTQGKVALAAAAARKAPDGPPREFHVNNETGDDSAGGLAADKAFRTLAKAVSMLKPGDTLHLAVTGQPYRETLRFGDDFGGVPGKPITIAGHGATLTGSDPLRLDGWTDAGPGLYKSTKFMSELEEFTDEAKLMRVYFLFDGVQQTMGRSSKGNKARFKAPGDLKPGEWTYAEAEKAFYLKVDGKLADAKIEAPYRRNGVAIRTPKTALTHVVIKDLIVCHVLNDGYNLHGTTQDLLLQNIAAYECGDDGISPHETCTVTIDGYWAIGNSTGMANGNLSVTRCRNVRLEGNLAHQFMTGHAPVTEMTNAIIIAQPGTQPVNITNSQDTRTTFDNVRITAPKSQKVLNVTGSKLTVKRPLATGPPGKTRAASRPSTAASPARSRICRAELGPAAPAAPAPTPRSSASPRGPCPIRPPGSSPRFPRRSTSKIAE